VEGGVATGFEVEELLKEPAGDQEYVKPPLPLSVVPTPGHMLVSLPAFAKGRGLTVIVTLSLAVQPPLVPTTV
jgi:hypothetical protein